MKKENRAWIFPVLLFILVTIAFILFFAVSAKGDEVVVTSQPPNFEEFQKWFGPRAKPNSRNDQLFQATRLLLDEMEKDVSERDLPGAIASNRCGTTPSEWQGVMGVAFSYTTWQEICILRGEVAKLVPGMTRAEMIAEISRLEVLLKAELQKILDGQAETNIKMDTLQKSIDDLAKKGGPQMESLLKESKEQIKLLNDIVSLLKGMDVKIDRIEVKIDKLLNRPQIQPEVEESEPISKEAPLEYYWPEEDEIKRLSLFGGIGIAGGQKIYPNPFGFVADSAVFHTEPWLPVYFEGGVRFLFKGLLGPQIFGAYGSTWFAGAGLVGYIEPLDISLSVGAQCFPEDLIGRLEPIQIFLELTHEGDWTRMSLRVVPQLNLAQLSAGIKF